MKEKLILLIVLAVAVCAAIFAFRCHASEKQVIKADKQLPSVEVSSQPDKPATSDEMLSAAQAFLAALPENAHSKTVFSFESDDRQNFNFVPMVRKGLPLQEMTEEQRHLAFALVETGLSERGYSQAKAIVAWEDILSDTEGRPRGNDYRNPELYYLAIFGEPRVDKPWGWRFEGHHLSLNYTSVTDKLSVTPNFMGANPAQIPSGERKGGRLLPAEEDLARRLVQSMDEAQRRMAVIFGKAFPEILTGNDRIASMGKEEGVPYEALLPEQQELLDMLINNYLGRMKNEVAEAKWAVINREGLEHIYFSWAGSLQKGEGHYYRIHGKSFLIEYDNTQNNANHIHTVWREFDGDFGRDLLKEHYEKSHRH